jgi:hypothetical protein
MIYNYKIILLEFDYFDIYMYFEKRKIIQFFFFFFFLEIY